MGRKWKEAGSVLVIGSSYADFFSGYQTRRRFMRLQDYLNAGRPGDFQEMFLGSVVIGDADYYEKLADLFLEAGVESESVVVTDLCRASFVCVHADEKNRLRTKGDESVLRENEARFLDYVRANLGWHNARLNEGNFRVVVALGRLARDGVKRWLRQGGWRSAGPGAFRSPTGRVISLVHAPHPAAWGNQRPADAAEELRYLLRGGGSTTGAPKMPHADRPRQPVANGLRRLIDPLTSSALRPNHRDWTGNDEKGNNAHHGAVPLSESPLDIKLAWRRSSSAATRLVGCFRLDLIGLLNSGYAREDSHPGHVRLKFIHLGNSIYIGRGGGAPALVVGAFDDP